MSQQKPKPEPKRRHRSKFQLKTIHVDELLNAAGMSGYLSVLEPPAKTSPEHLERLASEMLEEISHSGEQVPDRYQDSNKKGVPETGIPITKPSPEKPQLGIPESGISEKGVVEKSSVVVSGVPDWGIPRAGIPQITVRTPNIRQAVLAQDGHSLGEQLVYQTLWDHGSPHDSDSKVISIGYRTLSGLCRLTVNNCKANLLGLAKKLAIQEVNVHSAVQAKTYLVYSYQAILRRRRTAGLTHYIKSRGVTFVEPATGTPIQGIPGSGIPPIEPGTPQSGIPEPQTGVPSSDISGTPESAPLSLDIFSRQSTLSSASSSSSVYPLIRSALVEAGIPTDDDAILTLAERCTEQRPAITDQQIAELIRLKLNQVSIQRMQNPMGFLMTAVPKSVRNPAIEVEGQPGQSREMSLAEAYQQIIQTEEQREEMHRVIADPQSSEEDRKFALRILQRDR